MGRGSECRVQVLGLPLPNHTASGTTTSSRCPSSLPVRGRWTAARGSRVGVRAGERRVRYVQCECWPILRGGRCRHPVSQRRRRARRGERGDPAREHSCPAPQSEKHTRGEPRAGLGTGILRPLSSEPRRRGPSPSDRPAPGGRGKPAAEERLTRDTHVTGGAGRARGRIPVSKCYLTPSAFKGRGVWSLHCPPPSAGPPPPCLPAAPRLRETGVPGPPSRERGDGVY